MAFVCPDGYSVEHFPTSDKQYLIRCLGPDESVAYGIAIAAAYDLAATLSQQHAVRYQVKRFDRLGCACVSLPDTLKN